MDTRYSHPLWGTFIETSHKDGEGVSLFVTQVYKVLGTFIKDNIQRGISTKLRVT